MEPDPTVPAYGPSEQRDEENKLLCREMTKTDIDEVVQAFAKAALDAKRIGFDGVEIHGAHGYLIDQFLYSGTNKRKDSYGGSIENRCRFAKEIIVAIRKAVGKDFPILFRLSQWKINEYSARIAENPEDLKIIIDILAGSGVDIFHCSSRRYWLGEFENSDLNLAAWVKKISGKPTIAVGSVGLEKDFLTTRDSELGVSLSESLTKLEKPIKEGQYDLVAVGRGLIANPDWTEIVKSGDLSKLKGFSKKMLNELI